MTERELNIAELELILGNRHMSEEDYVEFLKDKAQKGDKEAKILLAEMF